MPHPSSAPQQSTSLAATPPRRQNLSYLHQLQAVIAGISSVVLTAEQDKARSSSHSIFTDVDGTTHGVFTSRRARSAIDISTRSLSSSDAPLSLFPRSHSKTSSSATHARISLGVFEASTSPSPDGSRLRTKSCSPSQEPQPQSVTPLSTLLLSSSAAVAVNPEMLQAHVIAGPSPNCEAHISPVESTPSRTEATTPSQSAHTDTESGSSYFPSPLDATAPSIATPQPVQV